MTELPADLAVARGHYPEPSRCLGIPHAVLYFCHREDLNVLRHSGEFIQPFSDLTAAGYKRLLFIVGVVLGLLFLKTKLRPLLTMC